MFRTTLKADHDQVLLSIPKDYIGEELEIIAFTKDEGVSKRDFPKKEVSFTVLHVKDKNYTFNRDEANER